MPLAYYQSSEEEWGWPAAASEQKLVASFVEDKTSSFGLEGAFTEAWRQEVQAVAATTDLFSTFATTLQWLCRLFTPSEFDKPPKTTTRSESDHTCSLAALQAANWCKLSQ